MEHASADDGQEMRSEMPEAYVKHMPFTILVRVKRTGTNNIREVKRKVFALFKVSLVFRLYVNTCCRFMLRLTRTKRFIRPMMKAT